MIFVEPRAVTRWYHEWLAVLVALILTLLTASVLLAAIGLDPLSSLHRIFIKPLNSVYGISELLAKATPLITIGVALALGFRAGVWNIGAEGQLVMGGLCGGAVALAFWGVDGFWVMPLVLLGGTIGGLFWGAITAFLKVRSRALAESSPYFASGDLALNAPDPAWLTHQRFRPTSQWIRVGVATCLSSA